MVESFRALRLQPIYCPLLSSARDTEPACCGFGASGTPPLRHLALLGPTWARNVHSILWRLFCSRCEMQTWAVQSTYQRASWKQTSWDTNGSLKYFRSYGHTHSPHAPKCFMCEVGNYSQSIPKWLCIEKWVCAVRYDPRIPSCSEYSWIHLCIFSPYSQQRYVFKLGTSSWQLSAECLQRTVPLAPAITTQTSSICMPVATTGKMDTMNYHPSCSEHEYTTLTIITLFTIWIRNSWKCIPTPRPCSNWVTEIIYNPYILLLRAYQ